MQRDQVVETAVIGAMRLARTAANDLEGFAAVFDVLEAECPITPHDDVESVRMFIRAIEKADAKLVVAAPTPRPYRSSGTSSQGGGE